MEGSHAAGRSDAKRLLLISNSTPHGGGYLDHVESEIREFLGAARHLLFVPFALFDRDAYAELARARFERIGYPLRSLHRASDILEAVESADGVFVGGGNTFRLLNSLYSSGVMPALRAQVARGIPYIGSSAGSIVACPSLKTTKDMPVVEPPSFEALGLVDFQISPHYLDPDPSSTHMGETQEERIQQFLEENELPVVGLREGSFLRVESGSTVLKGKRAARVFRRGHSPLEVQPGSELRDLLSADRSGR
jgi:dipeptidase E